MRNSFEEQIELEEEVGVLEGEDHLRELTVFNDDFNTFDHVINTLINVCEHSVEQAEQCTWIIHYKGKCCVKKGSQLELEPKKRGILDAGIDAAIL